MNSFNEEISSKLGLIRNTLSETGASAVRLRGTDWFAWATAGASNAVLLAAETGVAEVVVTAQAAWILTDEIEAERLQDEELPGTEDSANPLYKLYINLWADSAARESFIRDVTAGGKILSDRPTGDEAPLPSSLVKQKRVLIPCELERYRQVGRLASEAMTEVLSNAQPTWTEYQLAGASAQALWSRGLHPALTLVAGERRLPLYRHATPKEEPLGRAAMLVFCARGYGLYANLTRFVFFGSSQANAEIRNYASGHRHIREIEAEALNFCLPDKPLNGVYDVLDRAYHQHGYPQAIRQHHQGGTTGYLSREIIVNPSSSQTLAENMAIAWNPSLPGAKIEDTFIILKDGRLENLTFDPKWPSVKVEGRDRPVPLEID
ncbi:M24 family metallopeptidase (plasmid) [Nostoc edaphicum CCNP1411]|uniref:M24 family metallopeptidase n=1 Tax=Nostoc edaphicum CCNP1411 TaxID=1472755 RepID=A0A7D7QJB7_9NOSO|nr:M24 family metallopeptidase [Nostoc edaphicum]QMS86180.1 M24 family metallopeptidase [Nostoc edaphicum CCNP1411]